MIEVCMNGTSLKIKQIASYVMGSIEIGMEERINATSKILSCTKTSRPPGPQDTASG